MFDENCPPLPVNAVCRSDEEPSVLERLACRKNQLTAELEKVDAAIDALGEHPEINDVLTKISKAIGRL